jgi:hypothetical protein
LGEIYFSESKSLCCESRPSHFAEDSANKQNKPGLCPVTQRYFITVLMNLSKSSLAHPFIINGPISANGKVFHSKGL